MAPFQQCDFSVVRLTHCSSATEHVRVNPGLHVLIIQLLAQQQQYNELWQLIVGKVMPPSKTVAFQLLEVGTQDIATRKLGMDMLRQLHGHTDYVTYLLQEGRILEAICHVRQKKVWLDVVSNRCSQTLCSHAYNVYFSFSLQLFCRSYK